MSDPDERKTYWLIFFEDQDVRPLIFAYEDAARAEYARCLDNWNCHLFKQVSHNGRDLSD